MDARHVIQHLTDAGCRLIPDDDRLRVQDPQRRLTDDLRGLIRAHKLAILDVLRRETCPAPERGHPPSPPPPAPQGPAVTADSANTANTAHGTACPEPAQASGGRGRSGRSAAQRHEPWGAYPAAARRQRAAPSREATVRRREPSPPARENQGQTPEEDGVRLELEYDRVVHQFLEAYPEWQSSPKLVCRYDRQAKAYLVGFKASALQAFVHYVTTSATGFHVPERQYYTALLDWLVTHGVPQLAHSYTRPPRPPDVLPGQLPLFD